MGKAKAPKRRSSKKATQVGAAVKHALFSLYLHCELHEHLRGLHPADRNGDGDAHRKALKKHNVMPLATAVATLKKQKTPDHLLKFAIMMLARAMPQHGLKHASVLARKLPPAKVVAANATNATNATKKSSAARVTTPELGETLRKFDGELRGAAPDDRLHHVRESLAGQHLDRYQLSQRSVRVEGSGRPHVR
jgi:hypothetical protein